MAQPTFFAAVFAIIRDDAGRILFQQRQNTGFRDGQYQLPSGHVEWSETLIDAMRRELREELDIQVEAHDMRVIHIAHTIAPDRVYFNTYIEIDSYEGTITNMEPTKCSELQFFDIDTIRDDPRFAYEIETLSHIMQGIPFSEKII